MFVSCVFIRCVGWYQHSDAEKQTTRKKSSTTHCILLCNDNLFLFLIRSLPLSFCRSLRGLCFVIATAAAGVYVCILHLYIYYCNACVCVYCTVYNVFIFGLARAPECARERSFTYALLAFTYIISSLSGCIRSSLLLTCTNAIMVLMVM